MMTFLFIVLMFVVFGKLLFFAIRATWSIAKIFFTLIFLPLVLIVLVIKGLLVIALPVLVIVGLVSLFGMRE